jgi:ParB family transcriptional regulator, chromosome partitioning protein
MSDHLGDKSRRLGRGLGALISAAPVVPVSTGASDRLKDIPIALISPNPRQPRRDFPENESRELEASLQSNGLLQPISLRPRDGAYELIAGERRLRAAKALGWTTIQAVIRDTSDTQMLTLALVENLQREDLNPIEEAEGYRQLMDELGLSQLQVSQAVGKDRSTVSNVLRLLNLPAEVQQLVRDGGLSLGHARALLALPADSSLIGTARQIVAEQMTVRDVERLAQAGRKARKAAVSIRDETDAPPEIRRITDRLRRHLQTDVQVIADENARGELRIRFYSADDLERLLALITGTSEDAP